MIRPKNENLSFSEVEIDLEIVASLDASRDVVSLTRAMAQEVGP